MGDSQAVAVWQFAVAELAEGVVAVAQGGPALLFGDEAVLQVVFVGQRPLAVVDGGEAAEAVVGVGDFAAVGQGFDQQASGTVALVGGFQRLGVGRQGVGVFGFFQQVAVEVVGVGGFAAVKADFLSEQAVGVVVELVVLVVFVFDAGEQQAGVVVAGDVAAFVAFGGDFAVGVVAPGVGFTTGLGDLTQAACGVPFVVGEFPTHVGSALETAKPNARLLICLH